MNDDIVDRYDDYAIVCPCGGVRAKRYNLLRNQTTRFCQKYSLRLEVEKSGLFSERLDEEKLEGESIQDGRRSADVFLPK